MSGVPDIWSDRRPGESGEGDPGGGQERQDQLATSPADQHRLPSLQSSHQLT